MKRINKHQEKTHLPKQKKVAPKPTTQEAEASRPSTLQGGTGVIIEEKIKENTKQISTQGKNNETTSVKAKEQMNDDKRGKKTYRASTLQKGSESKCQPPDELAP